MDLIILRHGMRDPMHPDRISKRGEDQAASLCQVVATGGLPNPTLIWSSPKIRTQQTLLPMSQQENIKIEVDERLDERHHTEDGKSWQGRITSTLNDIEKLPSTCRLYVCSHFDWLDEFSCHLPSDELDLDSFLAGEYRHFKRENGVFLLNSRQQLLNEF